MANEFIRFTWSEVSNYYASRIPNLNRRRATEWRGPCPIHRGKSNSFAVNAETGLWRCFSKCGRGGDIISLERELTGAGFVTARNNVFHIVGRDLPAGSHGTQNAEARRRFARRKALAETLATSARHWHRATVKTLYEQKAAEPQLSLAWMASCRALYLLESMAARDVIEAYLQAVRKDPQETARRIAWAEADERECAKLTAIVVRLIAVAEERVNAA